MYSLTLRCRVLHSPYMMIHLGALLRQTILLAFCLGESCWNVLEIAETGDAVDRDVLFKDERNKRDDHGDDCRPTLSILRTRFAHCRNATSMLTPVLADVSTKGQSSFLANALASAEETFLFCLRSHLLATTTQGIRSCSRALLTFSYNNGSSSKVSLSVTLKTKRKPSPERYHCSLSALC